MARQSGDPPAGRTDGAWAPAQPSARPPQPRLRLGMTQDEVRALWGEPTSVEVVAGFVLWHYGAEAHGHAVVFTQETGRVMGATKRSLASP